MKGIEKGHCPRPSNGQFLESPGKGQIIEVPIHDISSAPDLFLSTSPDFSGPQDLFCIALLVRSQSQALSNLPYTGNSFYFSFVLEISFYFTCNRVYPLLPPSLHFVSGTPDPFTFISFSYLFHRMIFYFSFVHLFLVFSILSSSATFPPSSFRLSPYIRPRYICHFQRRRLLLVSPWPQSIPFPISEPLFVWSAQSSILKLETSGSS